MRRKYSVSSKFRKPLSLDGLFYSHGLMCASYPGTVITFVGIVIITCSLPFFITTSGDLNRPKSWRSPWLNYRVMTSPQVSRTGEGLEWIIDTPSQSSGKTPSWFLGLPVAVIQQVYVHLAIDCQQMEELCDKSYYSTSRLTAAHLLSKMEHAISACQSVIHPAALNLTRIMSLKDPFPPLYSSRPPNGVFSPVLDSFRTRWEDTPLDYHSIKELIYGGFWEYEHNLVGSQGSFHHKQDQTGFVSSPLHSKSGGRQYKHHSFAVTLLLRSEGKKEFKELIHCVEGLGDIWPDQKTTDLKFMKHFYYEPKWYLLDFAPLMGVYIIVFLYISFSVGKIDLVKSKIGLGFTAFLTVVAALTMSLGICTFFGLSISLSGSEIYPYVVITIGLENILIIVKAVMSTPEELEVKYRVAVGLSKEGWAITRNLITLVAMMTSGVIFFNYVLKEFCIIALVGLVCDTFLQLVFFPTVLSIDLRRLELSDLSSAPVPVPDTVEKTDPHSSSPQCRPRCPSSLQVSTPMRWRSKRIKFIYFLARTRIVSRILMLSLLVLLCALCIKTDTFHRLVSPIISRSGNMPTFDMDPSRGPSVPMTGKDSTAADSDLSTLSTTPPSMGSDPTHRGKDLGENSGVYWTELVSALNQSNIIISRQSDDGFLVTCENGEVCWRPMVTTHWPHLLKSYGFHLDGRFLTLLPPINLEFNLGFTSPTVTPSIPSSPLTQFVSHPLVSRTSFLVIVAVMVVSYSLYLIRSSRFRHERYMQSVRLRGYNRMVCLKGHRQDVDFLCVDSGLMVTTSLDGDIRVWDVHPMKRRCAKIIARSELCREPPPEVSSSSHRPAAEGCEATSPSTPTTTKYAGSLKGINGSRRGSIISSKSRSSSISDYNYDYYGNKNGLHSASRLSSVSDVSSLDPTQSNVTASAVEKTEVEHSNLSIDVNFPLPNHSHQTTPIPAASSIPIRKFSSSQTLDGNQAVYSFSNSDAKSSTVSLKKSLSSQSYGLSSNSPTGSSRTTSLPRNSPSTAPSIPTCSGNWNRVPDPQSTITPYLTEGEMSSHGPLPRLSSPLPAQQLSSPLPQDRPHPSSVPLHHPAPQHSTSSHTPPPLLHPSTLLPQSRPHPSIPPHEPKQQASSIPDSQPTPPLDRTSVQLHPALPSASSSYQQSSAVEPSCVHVQLEPENSIPNSKIGSSQKSDSRTNLALQSDSNTRSVSQSYSSFPTTQSSLHFTTSHSQVSSSSQSQYMPSIQVTGISPPTTRNNFRRMGHTRHASLGNIPRQRPSHSRNRSLGSVNASHILPPRTLNSRQGSLGNLSMISNMSEFSATPNFLDSSQLPKTPDPDKGYDFTQHFDLFSQYTSNMALECSVGEKTSEDQKPSVPPVWCMAFWNRVIAVGCGNGQVEAWNAITGSLIFSMNIGNSGISTIAMNSAGIVTGQMDGVLNLIGHNGLLHHCVPAHDKPISVLRWYGNKIITGGYDNAVKVHRTSASLNRLVCVNSVFVHEGNILALAVVESQLKLGCVSGCSKGLAIHWDINTGSCINEFGMYHSSVLQLEPTIASIVGLFGDGCVRVWDVVSGDLVHSIVQDGVCHDFTVLSSQHIALSLESCVEVYDLENRKLHSEKQLEVERGVSIVRHIQALDGASVVCSSGKDVYIIPCDLKLKTD